MHHLRKESSNGDSLAFVDVVQGRTQTLHDGGQPRTSMLSHRPADEHTHLFLALHIEELYIWNTFSTSYENI